MLVVLVILMVGLVVLLHDGSGDDVMGCSGDFIDGVANGVGGDAGGAVIDGGVIDGNGFIG